jgi:hypothetical protein
MSDSDLSTLPADHIWSPKMRAFGARWAAGRAGHAYPSRAGFRAEEWGPWWSSMLLYRVEPDGASAAGRIFRMTYQGDEVEYTDGGPKIGRRLEEIAPPAILARTLEIYGRVVSECLPIYSIRIGAWRQTRRIAFERLLLPMGPPDGPPDHVLGLLLDHGLDDNLKRDDLFAQSPTLDALSFVMCRIDPESFADCGLQAVGKGIGLMMP